MLTNEKINEILGITESYQAPQVLLDSMLDDDRRASLFTRFFEHERDMCYEWFQMYFEEEQAQRKQSKQDFTPTSVSMLVTELSVSGNTYFECAAGTGSMLIQAWDRHRKCTSPWNCDARSFWYHVEELSDRAIPFLIFNMSIRGMNGVIIHGDSLTREAKAVYFIRNMNNVGFSDVIPMPQTEILGKELNISFPNARGGVT